MPFTEALDEIIERKYRAFLRNFNGYWVNGTIEWMSQRVLLWLFFKVFFTQKNILIIFFYFLKIIFEISTLKWFENIKNILLQSKKKKIQIFLKIFLKSTPKRAQSPRSNRVAKREIYVILLVFSLGKSPGTLNGQERNLCDVFCLCTAVRKSCFRTHCICTYAVRFIIGNLCFPRG